MNWQNDCGKERMNCSTVAVLDRATIRASLHGARHLTGCWSSCRFYPLAATRTKSPRCCSALLLLSCLLKGLKPNTKISRLKLDGCEVRELSDSAVSCYESLYLSKERRCKVKNCWCAEECLRYNMRLDLLTKSGRMQRRERGRPKGRNCVRG